MQDKLYIPAKLKVGFQSRTDTYTKKLSFIVYYDEKGVLKKEGSWKKWCDVKIASKEVDNVPHEGFHLNKGVQRNGYYGGGRSMCRIYDDRGFEFEITIDNLMFILMGDDCLKRGLQGSYVYAWHGNNLVLLPTNSEEYLNSQKFTALQGKSIAKEDLVPGVTYRTKQQKDLIYIGKRDWLDKDYKGKLRQTNGYVFYKEEKHHCYGCQISEKKYTLDCNFELLDKIDSLAIAVTDTPISNYAELVDKYQAFHGSSIKEHKSEDVRLNYDTQYHGEFREVYYNEIAPNKYQVNKIFEIREQGGYSYHSQRTLLGYNIKPYKTVTFDETGMKVKSCSKKDTKLYSKSELDAMNFKKLSVILSSNNNAYQIAL